MKRDTAAETAETTRTSRGRDLSRREMLRRLLGASVVAALAVRGRGRLRSAEGRTMHLPRRISATGTGRTAPSCVVRPEQTEGPYFVDEKLNRSDIRSDPSNGTVRDGLPLHLLVNVNRIDDTACTPLAGAVVDVWHCDASGVYSDVQDMSFDTRGQKFLRGYQVTDAEGAVEFITIYPGWYQGRTVHIHFKIRTDPAAARGYEFTSQLYFDDAITDQVHAQPPYAAKGRRTTRNANDGIYRQGGDELILQLTKDAQGYVGTFDIALEMVGALPTATPGPGATTTPSATTEPSTTSTPTATPSPVTEATPTPPAGTEAQPIYLPKLDRTGQ